MNRELYTTIVATGSYDAPNIVKNDDFLETTFFDPSTGKPFERDNREIIDKFNEITKIEERKVANESDNSSDLAAYAAIDALESSGYDKETLDFIIVANNFGDATSEKRQTDLVPALANRVKRVLEIKNPQCYAHDVVAGCPGWTTAFIVANAYIKSGIYKRGLVIGSDITTRHSDPYDRDQMIFSDGAGAVIVEAKESDTPVGILSQSSRSDSEDGLDWLKLGTSLNSEHDPNDINIRMLGNKVYVYALTNVPNVVKDSLDRAGVHLDDIKKVFIHQANEKMDEAILARTAKLYGKKSYSMDIMPMNIRTYGNSSAATVPTLYDMVIKGKMPEHEVNPGDTIIFASVGAGMNINSIVYKLPE